MKNKLYFYISLVMIVCSPITYTVTIYNKTDYDLWTARYQKSKSMYSQIAEPQSIPKHSFLELAKQSVTKNGEHYIAVDYSPLHLASTIDQARWRNIVHKRSDYFYRKTLYIERVVGILAVYNSLEWNVVNPFLSAFYTAAHAPLHFFDNHEQHALPAIVQNPYRDEISCVREGNDLSPAEQACVEKRKPKVKQSLELLLQQSIPDSACPKISCAFSGGGLRAAVATLGFLDGLQKTDLLDTVLYGAFISGSTWAYAGLSLYGGALDTYKQEFFKLIEQGIVPKTKKQIEQIREALLVKVVEGQPLTLIDIFGALIGNTLLSASVPNPHQCYLSQTGEKLQNGDFLFPIYTAINADDTIDLSWYEFTPFEAGAAWLGKYIPLWSLGRKFVDGKSTDCAPEQPIGYMLGLFGSSFAAQIEQIYQTFSSDISSQVLKTIIEVLLKPVSKDRLTYAQLHNFSMGMYKHSIPQKEFLQLADAGSDPGFNFPYPPLSEERPERSSDIIIFFNMAIDTTPGESLLSAQDYARHHNLKFPPVAVEHSNDHTITIFKDDTDPTVPVIVYIPLINNVDLKRVLEKPEYASYRTLLYNFNINSCVASGACSTYATKYDIHTSEQLAALAELQVVVNKEKIVDTIKAVVTSKQR